MERETRDREELQMKRGLFSSAGILLVLMTCVLCGCATTKFTNIDEYHQLTKQAEDGVEATLRSLQPISAHPNKVSARQIAAYEREVQSLHVNSIKIRARAQAIQARGDAYFASWSESLAAIKDSRVRERANRYRPQLEASFGRIKAASQGAGTAFKPFSAGLQKLRVELETKPGGIDNSTNRDLIGKTAGDGLEVLKQLGSIDSELVLMKKLLSGR
jgi:hypothetical protein